MKQVFGDAELDSLVGNRKSLIREISGHVTAIKQKVHDMIEARKVCNKIENESEKAFAYDAQVRPYLEEIRYHVDKLELSVDNEMWPLPKYRELLFFR